MQTLSENHRRAFTAIAVIIEKRLIEMELSFLKRDLADPVIVHSIEDLDVHLKDSIRRDIADLKRLLRDFRDAYGLDPDKRSQRLELNITASFLWEDLVGLSGKKMDAYGTLDDVSKAAFDRFVEDSVLIVEKIMSKTVPSKNTRDHVFEIGLGSEPDSAIS